MSKENNSEQTNSGKNDKLSYVTHGEKSLYKVNKFTMFQEKFENFMYDFMEGTEEDDDLGWYRKVKIKDEDKGHEKKTPKKTVKYFESDNKTPANKIKPSSNENDEKVQALNEMNKDLLDEVHSLKTKLQKSNEEKESLEEELLLCYEQKDNLKNIIRQLHDGKEQGAAKQNVQPKEEPKETKSEKSEKQKSKDPSLGGDSSTWEDKVKLWKKILKGIEMDMIISSKKKAASSDMHLEFMKRVEANSKERNELLSSFYFSSDEGIHGDYSFRDNKEEDKNLTSHVDNNTAKSNESDTLLDMATLPAPSNDSFQIIPSIPSVPPPLPPQDDNKDGIIDLIGLDTATYDAPNSTSLASDLFAEQITPVGVQNDIFNMPFIGSNANTITTSFANAENTAFDHSDKVDSGNKEDEDDADDGNNLLNSEQITHVDVNVHHDIFNAPLMGSNANTITTSFANVENTGFDHGNKVNSGDEGDKEDGNNLLNSEHITSVDANVQNNIFNAPLMGSNANTTSASFPTVENTAFDHGDKIDSGNQGDTDDGNNPINLVPPPPLEAPPPPPTSIPPPPPLSPPPSSPPPLPDDVEIDQKNSDISNKESNNQDN